MTALNDRRNAARRPHTEPALLAYESCAEYYDLWTADYDHEGWLATIDRVARAHGFDGGRVLDVACGTGKSTAPLVRRGYQVSACDLSPAMVRRARMRLGDSADVFLADMRWLPANRRYELITCLDDAVNYLLRDVDLVATMCSFAAALAPDGLAIFDLNTTSAYRDAFRAGFEAPIAEGRLRYRGGGQSPDGTFLAVMEPIDASGRPGAPSLHVQRHHSPEAVRRACEPAGLELARIYGQTVGARLHDEFDESTQTKLLYVARKPREGVVTVLKP